MKLITPSLLFYGTSLQLRKVNFVDESSSQSAISKEVSVRRKIEQELSVGAQNLIVSNSHVFCVSSCHADGTSVKMIFRRSTPTTTTSSSVKILVRSHFLVFFLLLSSSSSCFIFNLFQSTIYSTAFFLW